MDISNQNEKSENTLSIKEVAERLRVSQRTLRTWIKAQKIIGFFRIGRKWSIRKKDLDKFIGQKIDEASNL